LVEHYVGLLRSGKRGLCKLLARRSEIGAEMSYVQIADRRIPGPQRPQSYVLEPL
jgi:hypothetical protein